MGLDDTYYPVGVGNTWVYRTDYGASSLGVVTDTEVITAVTPVADGASVTFVRTFHYLKAGHADFKSTVKYVFHHDGSLTVPYQSDVASANAKITVKSGSIVWPTPAELLAGTAKTGTVKVSTTVGGQTLDETVDVSLKGTGASRVTVPAGSFSVRGLSQKLTVHVPAAGVTTSVDTTAYLAKGTGMVKTVVGGGIAGTSSAAITSVLVSFKKG